MRYLAIDHGTKRTGLAICDAGETIASPLSVIHGQKELLKKIAEIVEAENVEAEVCRTVERPALRSSPPSG